MSFISSSILDRGAPGPSDDLAPLSPCVQRLDHSEVSGDQVFARLRDRRYPTCLELDLAFGGTDSPVGMNLERNDGHPEFG